MNFSSLFRSACASVIFISTITGCKHDQDAAPSGAGSVTLAFDNVVGPAPLVLDATTYTTAAGDAFTVSTLNYYISGIRLTRADGTVYAQPESYHLIKHATPASRTLTLANVPAGDYTGLSFTIGVDSARNVAGAQTGALDPSNGMFWTWSSGYIFAKLEGTSPQSPTRALTLHVGGFRRPNSAVRTVAPSFNGSTLQVRTDHAPEIHLKADVLKMVEGPNPLRFATTYRIMSAGTDAAKVADNYAAGMFRVEHIHAH